MIISLIFFFNVLVAQGTYEVELNTIRINDKEHKEISLKIGTSKFPADPTTDTLFLKDTLQIAGYQYFDYTYRLSYSNDARVSSNASYEGSFRLFIKSANDVKLVVDTDLDSRIQDEAIIDVRNSKASFAVTVNHNKLEYEFYIWNIDLVHSYDVGGVAIKPLSYFSGICKINDKREKIVVEDEALGVSIHMDNMLIGEDSIDHVMLNEPFLYENNYYSFSSFDLYDLTIALDSKSPDFIPEGYRKGYFVNNKILHHELGSNLKDKPILLYFWGIWCGPCISNFDKTLELYKKVEKENRAQMFLCSFNRDELQSKQCKDFVKKKIKDSNQVFIMEKDINKEMSDFIKYDSLISLLKIDTFPTYVLIDKNGKILFRDSKITNELLLLLKN